MCRSEKWTYLNLTKINSLKPLELKMRETPLRAVGFHTHCQSVAPIHRQERPTVVEEQTGNNDT
jgi:hypothetical protein